MAESVNIINKMSFQMHEAEAPRDFIQIPEFMVITGINGSGKTAFLKRVEQRTVELWRSIDDVDLRRTNIVYLSNADFIVWNNVDGYGKSRLIKFDMITVEIGEFIVRYRDKVVQNALNKVYSEMGRDVEYFDEVEFVKMNGREPCDQINEILNEFGIGLKIIPPELYIGIEYFIRFNNESGHIIDAGSLSSGEKNMMFLPFLIAKGFYVGYTKPEVILLDEVDAFMHPRMCKLLVSALQRFVIGQLKIQIIIVTHSLATVCCCSDADGIFFMEKGNLEPIRSSKAKALSALLEGVPKISVSYKGQRQIFVESDNDADIYTKAYTALQPDLNAEITLQFMSAGFKHNDGDKNNGWGVVKKIVKKLKKFGNNSTMGVIDWDGKNKSSGRIFVSAGGRRYSIENIICDPLILGMYIFNKFQHHISSDTISIINQLSDKTIFNNENICKKIADDVCRKVIKNTKRNFIECKYKIGHSIDVDREYLETNGHELVAKIFSAYPDLEKKYTVKGGKRLMVDLIENVIMPTPLIAPIELWDLFEELEGADLS